MQGPTKIGHIFRKYLDSIPQLKALNIDGTTLAKTEIIYPKNVGAQIAIDFT